MRYQHFTCYVSTLPVIHLIFKTYRWCRYYLPHLTSGEIEVQWMRTWKRNFPKAAWHQTLCLSRTKWTLCPLLTVLWAGEYCRSPEGSTNRVREMWLWGENIRNKEEVGRRPRQGRMRWSRQFRDGYGLGLLPWSIVRSVTQFFWAQPRWTCHWRSPEHLCSL